MPGRDKKTYAISFLYKLVTLLFFEKKHCWTDQKTNFYVLFVLEVFLFFSRTMVPNLRMRIQSKNKL